MSTSTPNLLNFNPKISNIHNETETQEEDKLVWTTENINKTIRAIEEGVNIRHSPFYENNLNYRKPNLVYEYTDEEYEEIKKCAKSPIYFANRYCKVMTDYGYETITLRDYQERVLQDYVDNRFVAFVASRQIGKTTTASIYLLWYLLFNYDKNSLLLSNKGATTKEIMDKIRVLIEGLPFFLKPGMVKKDVMTMVFDNRCRIISQNTTKNSGIGFTIHLLYVDEFAHIHDNIKRTLYENLYPTLSSSKLSRIILTSTPNGMDLFYEIYTAAVNKENVYKAVRVDWWEVPGRDEEWKQVEISNLGSEEAFNVQYGCQFLSSASQLLESSLIKRLEKQVTTFEFRSYDALDNLDIDYSGLKWNPKFNEDKLYSDDTYYIISIDLSEGLGFDYTVLNIFEVDTFKYNEIKSMDADLYNLEDFFKLNQIGIFISNNTNLDNLAKFTYVLYTEILNQENVKVIIENNTYGDLYYNKILNVNSGNNNLDENIIIKFKRSETSRGLITGLKLNRYNKPLLIENLRASLNLKRIDIYEQETIKQLILIGRDKDGKYKIQYGNDDIFMTCVNLTSVFDTIDYKDFVEEKFDKIPENIQRIIIHKIENIKGADMDIYDILF